MTRALEDRRALVTGASSGIGLAIARAMAEAGARLWLVARDEQKLTGVAQPLRDQGIEVVTSAADLTDSSQLHRLTAEVAGRWPRLDVLVNNAGLARFTPFNQVAPEELEAQLKLNLLAPFWLTQQLLPLLVEAQGCVINISSTSAHRLIPGRPASVYAMTKGGLNSLTKALALELGPQGIRVSAIAPGTVNTPLTQNMIAAMTPERRAEYERFVAQNFALGRLGEPEEIAAMAVHLASDKSKWTTGAVFVVDGGLSTN
jgi:NAD(P)-dependent dehydrogenase (short-subunit alcohol dehydrogenase family)